LYNAIRSEKTMFHSVKWLITLACAFALMIAFNAAPVAAQDTRNDDPCWAAGNADAAEAEAEEAAAEGEGADAQIYPCPGNEPETAGPPYAEAVESFPGVWHWYRFRYQANPNRDEQANVVVTLKMERAGCVVFDVTTTGRLRTPYDEDGRPIGPVGQGTPFNDGNRRDERTLLWVGSSSFSESYFVVVRSREDAPCTYTLKIEGEPVTY
jgi:hypothetical protein